MTNWYVSMLRILSPIGVLVWIGWSLIYRAVYHRKYNSVPLDRDLSPREVANRLAKLEWRRDSWKELFDTCGSPHFVQYALNELECGRPQPPGALDCDDFSCWASSAMHPKHKPRMYSAVWVTADKNIKGHVVCIYNDGPLVYSTGNWGIHGPYLSANEACADVPRLAGVPTDMVIGSFWLPRLSIR